MAAAELLQPRLWICGQELTKPSREILSRSFSFEALDLETEILEPAYDPSASLQPTLADRNLVRVLNGVGDAIQRLRVVLLALVHDDVIEGSPKTVSAQRLVAIASLELGDRREDGFPGYR